MSWHLPSQCEVCRRWCGARLCAVCLGRHAAPRLRCPRCALPVGVAGPCDECRRDAPPFEHAVCIGDYGFPWDGLIAAFKFGGRSELATLFAQPLAAATAAASPVPDVVVPVPLAASRLAERGYNQAWELARRVARLRRLRADAGLLERVLDGAHQAELTRAQRLANLRAAFAVAPRRRDALSGRRVALVDDVLTTGATAREAAAALRRAGAAAVDVWVVARTA